ncbi:DUF1648 domain-containing protein [Chryseobacterium echinoideorum]|uniref:DUF1648 domain-containing protein n=1 Tax=Chryseobacterium echinoideorum TaxID=1549648 RepID=UPI00118487BC|nr:DUF1648 domain-containing protein [Chryseobacterium echinoideorum]
MKTSSLLLTINSILLIFIWVFIGINYADLPDIVPSHFTVNGNVDGESEKKAIWILPVIATFMFLLLTGVSRNPDSPLLNVPNSYRNKEKLQFLANTLLLPVLLFLADTVVESVLIAQGKLQEMSDIVFVLLALVFVVAAIHIDKMIKESKSETSKA